MMTKKRIALAIAAVAVVATGCTSSGVAATVNGTEIYDSFVLGLRTGAEGDVLVSGEQFRNDLSRLIFTQAMLSAAEEDFGITGLESPETHEAFIASFNPAEQGYLVSVAQDPEFTESAVDVAVTQLLLRSEMRKALGSTDENLQDIWQNDQARLVRVCARHILVATEGEANDVHGRLEAAEDFAALAAEISLDTISPGGALPCPSGLSGFEGPFAGVLARATVGDLNPPVQTVFGWHVIIVDSIESPASLAEFALDPIAWIPDDILDAFWGGWLNDVVERADIRVRSQIGTWYPPVDGILRPPSSP
ncbi:MAG: peptidylprolyl isomerase [Actinomycetota bacterium]|nr:peptidylprolyl isomerase [Actinomycetota bacterium]MDK1026889.1 peptidylprolyl isomerase [Actinomycetota bacterium]MDK1291498.1 peptidylprolyl isomerase [Actinomycetota bacterium]